MANGARLAGPAKPTSLFLKPGGALSEKMAVEPESADTYTYDPRSPVPPSAERT